MDEGQANVAEPRLLTPEELGKAHQEMAEIANRLAETLMKFVAPFNRQGSMVGVYAYEANRRLEECMFRVGNCFAYLVATQTQAGIDQAVKGAIENGRVIVK